VVPLVHAHVSGTQAGIMPPSLTFQNISEQENLELAQSIEENGSPAITIPHEFKRNIAYSIPQPQLDIILELRCLIAITLQHPEDQPIIASSPYNKPHTQAPPVLG
jgi:hypothetical protein